MNATTPPRFVPGIGPPLEQIEHDYSTALAEIDLRWPHAKTEHRQCALDVLALAGEIRKLDAALGDKR